MLASWLLLTALHGSADLLHSAVSSPPFVDQPSCSYELAAAESTPAIFTEKKCFRDLDLPGKPEPIDSFPWLPPGPPGPALPPGTVGDAWWRVGWIGGKSPYSRQPFNAGWSFYNYASGNNDPQRYLSYMGGSDFNGGSVLQGKAAATTWDKVIGGPISDGPNRISTRTQLHFGGSTQTRFWWASADKYPDMWLGIYLVTTPAHGGISDEQYYQNWASVIRGQHDADYVMMGRRLRWFIETQSMFGKRHNRPEQIILRPNWEFTQDTSNGIYFIRYLMDRKGMSFQQAAKFYADGMWKFASNIRIGYNQDFEKKVRLRIAFSPAQNEKYGPMNEYLKHWPDTYDMIDLMNHPSRSKTKDMQAAYDNLYKVSDSKHTFAEAIPLARQYGLAIGSLEWSPVDTNYVTPNKGIYEYSIKLFHQLMVDNSDIAAFTGAFHTHFVTENHMSGTPYREDWQRTVKTHRAYFGRQ